MAAAISLTQVRKTYSNGTVGLQDVDLEVASGEYFVLTGPSGSGKSTLLRVIAGLETPEHGTVAINGVDSSTQLPHQRGMSFMPQGLALYPNRDVSGNIRLGAELARHRLPTRDRISDQEIEARTLEAARILGLEGLLRNRPHELSGGEQRRVMLARAVVRRAHIWLLDEPLVQLDSGLSEKLSDDLLLLRTRFGLTIIHVTHDPIEAMAMADRIGVLGGGRVLQTGTPAEVHTRPSSRAVGLLFGRPAINLVVGQSDGNEFVSNDGWLRLPCKARGSMELGIRPDDVRFGPAESFAHAGTGIGANSRTWDGRTLRTVRGPSSAIRGLHSGSESLEVWIRIGSIHWFDGITGLRITT